MTRAETLDKAKECVCGHREQDYGTPENNFQIIANYWNAFLDAKLSKDPDYVLKREDVAVMMALFKIGRITTGAGTSDSFVDACGYLACAEECRNGREQFGKDLVQAIEKARKHEHIECSTATSDKDRLETWKGC